MSRCRSALVAPTKAVAAPIAATTNITDGLAAKSGFMRATRYTPAVTIVAAASGSQV
jgi:hypothetical protein